MHASRTGEVKFTRTRDDRKCSQGVRVSSADVEFVLHVFPGWTSKQQLEEILNVVSQTSDACCNPCSPRTFPRLDLVNVDAA